MGPFGIGKPPDCTGRRHQVIVEGFITLKYFLPPPVEVAEYAEYTATSNTRGRESCFLSFSFDCSLFRWKIGERKKTRNALLKSNKQTNQRKGKKSPTAWSCWKVLKKHIRCQSTRESVTWPPWLKTHTNALFSVSLLRCCSATVLTATETTWTLQSRVCLALLDLENTIMLHLIYESNLRRLFRVSRTSSEKSAAGGRYLSARSIKKTIVSLQRKRVLLSVSNSSLHSLYIPAGRRKKKGSCHLLLPLSPPRPTAPPPFALSVWVDAALCPAPPPLLPPQPPTPVGWMVSCRADYLCLRLCLLLWQKFPLCFSSLFLWGLSEDLVLCFVCFFFLVTDTRLSLFMCLCV